MEYIYECYPRAEYRLIPRLREDAWAEFEARPLRKLTINVAGHPNVAGADNPNDATWANIGEMSERYGAHVIKIVIGMGSSHGSLGEDAKQLARDAYQRLRHGVDDIRGLRATVETGEGVPNEEINLIGELLDVKEDLTVPGNNWARFYTLRRNLLRSKLDLL